MSNEGLGILEKPTWYREYYSHFNKRLNAEYAALNNECEDLDKRIKTLKEDILQASNILSKYCNLNIYQYAGITLVDPSDKEFITICKKLYVKYSRNEHIGIQVMKLYKYAKMLEELNTKLTRLAIVRRASGLTIKQYNELLKTYMTKVHEELVLNGNGYMISPVIGTIVISRCKLKNPRKKLDFKATKANKKLILDNGGRLYDKDEAEFCAMNNMEYDGKDYRIYLDKNYVYEIPLIYPKFHNAYSAEFKVADYRGSKVRGKTNEDLIKLCERDTKRIIKLPLDFRTKLNMCLECDKMLYSKLIRNESQQPIATPASHRKD